MKNPGRVRLVVAIAVLTLAGGGLFLACGGGLGAEASPGACEGGACDADVSPGAPSVDASGTSKDGSTPASDAGGDARPLAPCGDGGLPGALDPSFGDGGVVYIKAQPGTGSAAYAVAIQPDGKTVLGAGVGDSIKSWFLLARLTVGGALDTSFGDGGFVDTPIPFGTGGVAEALVLMGDGRILAGGQARGDAGADLAIARYLPSGVLDGTFGDGGLVLSIFTPSQSASLKSMAVLPDGHVLAAGLVEDNLSDGYLIAKFNANGSLDTTFGAAGKVRVDIRSSDWVRAMVLQPDGKILMVGSSASTISVLDAGVLGPDNLSAVRLNPDGSLDPSFGSGGKVVLALATESVADAVALDGAGRIILGGGISAPGGADFSVFRLTPTGALDTTFGTGGVVSANFGANDYCAKDGLYIQPDGKYVMAGYSATSGPVTVRDALARFLPNGAPDLGFGAGGKTLVPSPGGFRVLSYAAAFSGDRATVAGRWDPLPPGTPPWMGASRYCL